MHPQQRNYSNRSLEKLLYFREKNFWEAGGDGGEIVPIGYLCQVGRVLAFREGCILSRWSIIATLAALA